MKVALTGHRPERLRGHEAEVRAWIEEQFQIYNFSEAYYDLENKKNEYEYIQYLKHPYKYKDKNDKGKRIMV